MTTLLDPSEGIAVFSDGSAYYGDRSGGWSWVAVDNFGIEESDSGFVADVTNNQMELYAPTQALHSIDSTGGGIVVYSDSEYVVLGVNQPNRAKKKNLDWWAALLEAIDLHDHVEFVHVKGHAESYYNR